LRDRTAGRLELTEGAVYPALHRLEDVGLLRSEWQLVGGRRRRIYRVSELGEIALQAERQDWRALVAAIESVLGPQHDAAAVSTQ
jgi:DNA-binding PadR family transcriptional regulator